MHSVRIGIDLGGTKIELAALDDTNQIIYRQRLPTPVNDYQATLYTIQQMILSAEQALQTVASVGIGIPGSPDRHGQIRNANSQHLNGQFLQADIERLLSRPVRLRNDADCFALSEAIDGAGADAKVVFGVIIGTGTGGGIVINRQLLSGPNGIAGEWGHNPLPWPEAGEGRDGPPCFCGRHGCIETFLSGPGFSARHRDLTGSDCSPAAIFTAAGAGSGAAVQSATLYYERLARALAHVINIIDPDVIVLGGGMSNVAEIYREVPRRWQPWIFSAEVTTRLRPATYGDSSGVRGAAWLWNDQ